GGGRHRLGAAGYALGHDRAGRRVPPRAPAGAGLPGRPVPLLGHGGLRAGRRGRRAGPDRHGPHHVLRRLAGLLHGRLRGLRRGQLGADRRGRRAAAHHHPGPGRRAHPLPLGPRMSGARIRLRGWGWRHAGREEWALRGVDLEIDPGERVLLLGPSGAGKSTLLHALAGLTGPESAITGEEEGELSVDGAPAERGRGGTGLVAQDPETQLVMARAGDDVAFGLENIGTDPELIGGRVREALAEVGFGHGPDRSTAALSGGEKQRLVIAGALAMRPRLLLLDEPTANLDPQGAAQVRAVLTRLAAESSATMVIVEHRVAEAVGLVDRVVVVEPGGGVVA